MAPDNLMMFFAHKLLFQWGKVQRYGKPADVFIESPQYNLPASLFGDVIARFTEKGFVAEYQREVPMVSRDGLNFTSAPEWFADEAAMTQHELTSA